MRLSWLLALNWIIMVKLRWRLKSAYGIADIDSLRWINHPPPVYAWKQLFEAKFILKFNSSSSNREKFWLFDLTEQSFVERVMHPSSEVAFPISFPCLFRLLHCLGLTFCSTDRPNNVLQQFKTKLFNTVQNSSKSLFCACFTSFPVKLCFLDSCRGGNREFGVSYEYKADQ